MTAHKARTIIEVTHLEKSADYGGNMIKPVDGWNDNS